ncbi:MAG: hypothetical protein K2F79_01015 [Muribaculaceae bacterium]|nr:hypothetical protein [Muribaculaceae bacterium]
MNDSSSRHAIALLVVSMSVLLLLSVVPWSALTSNVIKDFNLLEDLFPSLEMNDEIAVPVETDPELKDFIASAAIEAETDVIADVKDTASRIPEVYASAPMRDGVVMIENYSPSDVPLKRLREALSECGRRKVRVAVIGDSFIEGDIMCQNLRELFQQQYGGRGWGICLRIRIFPASGSRYVRAAMAGPCTTSAICPAAILSDFFRQSTEWQMRRQR